MCVHHKDATGSFTKAVEKPQPLMEISQSGLRSSRLSPFVSDSFPASSSGADWSSAIDSSMSGAQRCHTSETAVLCILWCNRMEKSH